MANNGNVTWNFYRREHGVHPASTTLIRRRRLFQRLSREEGENCLRTKTRNWSNDDAIEEVAKQTGPSDSVRSKHKDRRRMRQVNQDNLFPIQTQFKAVCRWLRPTSPRKSLSGSFGHGYFCSSARSIPFDPVLCLEDQTFQRAEERAFVVIVDCKRLVSLITLSFVSTVRAHGWTFRAGGTEHENGKEF